MTDIQQAFDNFIPVIPMKDDAVHTKGQPFCFDPTCGCHKEPALIGLVNQQYLDGLLTEEEATRTISGLQLF